MNDGVASFLPHPVPFHGDGKQACDSSLLCLSLSVLISFGSFSRAHTEHTAIDWSGEKD